MATDERAERVVKAWGTAYAEIGAAYPTEGEPLWPRVEQWAPGLAARIAAAEKAAEEASTRYLAGGPGGVQAAINIWRDTWLEAIKAINGRN
jgi:hypothetical protein